MVSETKKRVMITLSKKTLQRIDDYCAEAEMSTSQFIQFVLLDYLKRKEKE